MPPRLHTGLPRKRRSSTGSRLLLIIGTPGTGKRPVGSYLAEQCGFVYLDLENAETRERLLGSRAAGLRAEVATARKAGQGVVLTWEAGSEAQRRQVRRLRSLGFESIWFDSDRGAACQALFASGARGAARFRFVDSFALDGQFRAVASVAAELLEPRPRTRLLPARAVRRPAVPRVPSFASGLRFRIAAGLTFAAAAATTGGVLLAGGPSGARQPSVVAAVAKTAHAQAAATLPRRGVLVDGRSLAGVQLGDTPATVRSLWGHHFTRCQGCKPEMWFYFLPTGDPVGAGVEFGHGRVVAVFTLGSPTGWRTETGLKVGQVLETFNDPNDPSEWKSCSGYSAKSAPTTGNAVTSILTQGQAVYGFALTRPSVSPCH
jgi:hypothetical protein